MSENTEPNVSKQITDKIENKVLNRIQKVAGKAIGKEFCTSLFKKIKNSDGRNENDFYNLIKDKLLEDIKQPSDDAGPDTKLKYNEFVK